MKILIIYGTVEGQTRKIARYMEEVLQDENHQIVIADATEEPPSPKDFDAIFIGSSVHIQKYNAAIKEYIMDNVDSLNKKPSAFFSVCLAIASDFPEEHEEVEKIAQSFLKETGWNTNTIWHIAGALKYTKYNYFKRLVMKMISKKEGRTTDTSQDYEFTDWEQVKNDVLGFVEENSKI